MLLALLLRAHGRNREDLGAVVSKREPAAFVLGQVPRPLVVRSPAPTASASSAAEGPIVDEVSVEKSEVCEGEENLVSVKAHASDGTDAYLHTVIGSGLGMKVPVKTYLSADGTYPKQWLTVFGKNTSTRIELPHFEVKKCKPERQVLISWAPLANTVDGYEFTAKVTGESKVSFRPVRFLWDFGDGETDISRVPYVAHGYKRRAQNTRYSDFLVKVEAVSETGDSTTGRASVELYNLAFAELERDGLVMLFAEPNPRFPEMDERGLVKQKFRIWHAYSQAVEIQNLSLIRQNKEGERLPAKPLDIAVLYQTEIPPGESVEAELSFDTTLEPNIFCFVYRLEGTSADGRRALGEAVVLRPPPKLTRQNTTPITDPALVARIQAAIRITGKKTVTSEDLWHLEREGKLPH